MEKENVLIFNEKPYKTPEETRLYYQIALEEAIKAGNSDLITHYKLMLLYLDSLDNENKKTK